MKLKNHLIVTLPDFVRHFDFTEFWLNRRQFIRDMNPDKVYYYDQKLEEAFKSIKAWIELDDKPDVQVQNEGIAALSLLAGCQLDAATLKMIQGDQVDLSQNVITVQAGHTLNLPKFDGSPQEPFNLRLHKIEVQGQVSSPARIAIGGQVVGTLREGEAVYVSELNGGCVELLPNHLHSESWDLRLLNREHDFGSSLIVENLNSVSKHLIEGVTSFALMEDGFVYVDMNNKLVFSSSLVKKFLTIMCVESESVHYVKSNDTDDFLILYTDGKLKSTIDCDRKRGVYTSSIIETDNNERIILTN